MAMRLAMGEHMMKKVVRTPLLVAAKNGDEKTFGILLQHVVQLKVSRLMISFIRPFYIVPKNRIMKIITIIQTPG